RVLAGLATIGVALRRDRHAEARRYVEKQPQAIRVPKLGDPVEIGDKTLGVVLLRAREKLLQCRARCAGISFEDGEVQAAERSAMALEQPTHRLEADGAGELRVDELLEVLRHAWAPWRRLMFRQCSLTK